MDDQGFRRWLERTGDAPNTVNTRFAMLRRIEKHYGDLDLAHSDDLCESILTELSYSTSDARRGEPNPSRIPIEGDVTSNLASYRTHLRKYLAYLDQRETADLIAEEVEADAGPAQRFRYEQDLEAALSRSLEQIEPGLTLVEQQRSLPSGLLDVLARDARGGLVAIELKAVTAKREVLGQIAAYMADLQDETGTLPRGLIVAPEFDTKLISGARLIAGLGLLRYRFAFTFEPVE
ncbi:DUF91 domain-containing protein [Rhodobacteraceae bacterium CCMM004]|nr:DUF91 domain-containing protein [Rhodobacteraceae bacterium CCMM004]